jgi:hypothetical protein
LIDHYFQIHRTISGFRSCYHLTPHQSATMTFRSGCTTLFVATLVATANGFTSPSPSKSLTSRVEKTELNVDQTGWDSFAKMPPIKDISYGEESRQYRRTVYSHDDWKKHRSPDRFSYYIAAIFNSGVYKNLGREVIATTTIAAFVCAWNVVFGEYQDLQGALHAGIMSGTIVPALGLPLTPFTLASPSLGLLLGTIFQECFPHQLFKFLVAC